MSEFDVTSNATNLDLVYEVSTGLLFLGDHKGRMVHLADGYSGSLPAVNDPERQDEKAVGPIPVGLWHIERPGHHPRLGPQAFALEADKKTAIYGRSGFYIHGDNTRGNGTASTGCIILNKATRDLIAALWVVGVRQLNVVTGYRDGFPGPQKGV